MGRKEEKNNHWDTVKRRRNCAGESAEVLLRSPQDDPARQLNWLLTELSPAMAIQYLAGSRSLGEFDQKIPKQDQQQIWLSDVGLRGQKLEVSWRRGMRSRPLAVRGVRGIRRCATSMKQPGTTC